LLDNLLWMAPVRAKPRRSYDSHLDEHSPEGEHLPHLLKRISKTRSAKRRAVDHSRVDQYGVESGLFKSFEVHQFGDAGRGPFQISVDLGELVASIFNVGYGVSQALPVVAEVVAGANGTWFAIQQPEVHLHPRAQAAMGELFFRMAGAPHHKRFLVETHSDYLIDRFRSSMRKATDAGQPVPSAQVVFFRREGGKNVLHPLALSPRGEYPEEQPPGFRELFLQEELRNLGY
jgi:AAA ATPase domain